MQHPIHVAVQIVPISQKPIYPIIDKAIAVIDEAGLPYVVGPMETVIQGEYDQVFEIIKKAQDACLEAGADELVVTLKIHARKNGPVTFEEKNLNR